MTKILLVYPPFPSTYWGLQYALRVLGKKAYMPPLGLITIAAMLPPECQVRLRDLNCESLTDEDIAWADAVFISAMLNQKRSLFEIAGRCRAAGKTVVFGGPLPTGSPEECAPWCDTLVSGEAETVWDRFLDDLLHDRLQPRYASNDKPDVTHTPTPRFDLLNVDNYVTIPIQFSRGCPFQCEFCDIIVMFGRRPRTKTPAQMIQELEAVKRTGYRGEIFIVDDNFIGNKKAVKELLPVLEAWVDANRRAFDFGTEASVDLADHDDLLAGMVRSGFRWVFLGIETPATESLKETLKFQNLKEPLGRAVQRIRAAGLHTPAGFIIGFDNDGADIFDRQLEFISGNAIPLAMVGLLIALDGTPLHDRLKATGRLVESSSELDADQCGYTNIRTILPRRTLLEGYRRVIAALYGPDEYFDRAFRSFLQVKPPRSFGERVVAVGHGLRRSFRLVTGRGQSAGGIGRRTVSALTRAYDLTMSLPRDYRASAISFLWRVVRARPDTIDAALELIVFGFHMHRFTMEHVLPQLDAQIAALDRDDTSAPIASGPHLTLAQPITLSRAG